ncbi:MAG: PEP-CTERM sorting domain-containing protein [Pseudomonadales bacterium]|nr:PEP-CTERM sorting domain-containing protein [Pseudomonadales bacterium]
MCANDLRIQQSPTRITHRWGYTVKTKVTKLETSDHAEPKLPHLDSLNGLNKMTIKRTFLAAVLAGTMAMSVSGHAALITYDFGEESTGELEGSGDDRHYLSLLGGHQLTVHGYKGVDLNDLGDDVGDSFDDTEAVVVDTDGGSRGLSVDSEGGPDGDEDDADRLDGDGPDEALLFDFGGIQGTLVSIVFDNFGGNDDFNLVIDDIVTLVDVGGLANDTWLGALSFNQHFAIGADGANDVFRVRSVTVDVPEPSTLSLLFLGAICLIYAKRRPRVLA